MEDLITKDGFAEVFSAHEDKVEFFDNIDELDEELQRLIDNADASYLPFVNDMVAYLKT